MYGSQSGIHLEDLYSYRGRTHNWEGRNHRQKGIRGGDTKCRQQDFCNECNGFSGANNHANPLFLSSSSCFANKQENQNSH